MSQAVHTTTTSAAGVVSRRRALAGTAALTTGMAAGRGCAAAADAAEDAELLATVEALLAHQAEDDRLNDAAEATDDPAEAERIWATVRGRLDGYFALLDRAIALPARTPEGLRAKARLLVHRAQLDAQGGGLRHEDRLMLSVAGAILGDAALAAERARHRL